MYRHKLLVNNMEREMMELNNVIIKNEAARKEAQETLWRVKEERTEARTTNDKLQHEAKMIIEMKQTGIDTHIPNDGTSSLGSWMEERRRGLQNHLQSLQTFVQGQSRQAIQKRFGVHPRQVEIVLQIQTSHNQFPSRRRFVIEMFSMDETPHAVYFFLDSVDRKLWDDTVFLYDQANPHVLAAVPIDFKNQSIKQTDLQRLELQTLAFPEYNTQRPHEKYTVGFADLGPTFYVNMENNTQVNGPGGQAHHRLAHDADPCFGYIVAGHDVIDELNTYGRLQTSLSSNGEHPWVDTDHKIIRIASITILP
jgi:hypothetical protein